MELVMQIISHDKTVKSNTVQELEYFNSKSLFTQAIKKRKLVSIKPGIKKLFV